MTDAGRSRGLLGAFPEVCRPASPPNPLGRSSSPHQRSSSAPLAKDGYGPHAAEARAPDVRADRRSRATPARRLRRLAQRGINTVEAGDGMHGIAKAGTLLPDVIAVDFGRTRQDVVDMCFLLKRQDATKHIAIIAVTEVFTSN